MGRAAFDDHATNHATITRRERYCRLSLSGPHEPTAVQFVKFVQIRSIRVPKLFQADSAPSEFERDAIKNA
jgi:hypothetical protein